VRRIAPAAAARAGQDSRTIDMKILKIALYGLGGVALALAALLAYVAATFDPNDYRDELADAVAAQTGRTLTLAGDLRLTLFPKIGVGLGKTQLSEAASPEVFAAVNDLRVALAVIPLLSGRIVVDEIIVDGLQARLVRRADGTLNVDDLLGRDGADAARPEQAHPDASGQQTGTTGRFELDIQGIRVSDASLSWVDEQAGSRAQLSGVSLRTGRVARGVPTGFELAATVQATQPALDLRLQATGTLEADPEAGILAVNALRVQAGGQAACVRDLDATLTASLRTQAARVEITGLALDAAGAMDGDRFNASVGAPTLVLDQGALSAGELVATLSGRLAGIDLSAARLAVLRLRADLERQQLQFDRVSLKAEGQRAADRFTVTLEAPRLDISPDKASGQEIVASLTADGPALVARAGARLSAVEGTAGALRIAQLAIDVDARQGESSVKGRLATPVSGNLKARRFELPGLNGRFDVRSPALPTKSTTIPVTGSMAVDLGGEQIRADLALRFDESDIKAKFGLKGFGAPFYTFDVAIDQLDADRYRPQAKQPAATAKGGTTGEAGETPFDLSALKALHLDGTLRVGRLVLSGVKASNVRLDVKARDGKLAIDPLSASLYQGTLNGTVAVDAVGNGFAARQTLVGIAIGPLLRDALDQDLLDGRGNVDLDLSAKGNTVTALKQTLSGSADLRLRDGAIKGFNVGQSLRGAKNLFSAGGATESAASSAQQTDFSELSASFTIRNGRARNEDLEVKSPFVRLSGSGDIDVAQGALDYTAKVALVATSTGQGGKGLEDVAGLTVPLRVSGPFDALKYRLDFGSAAADRARQTLDQKKDALKQKLESQITDKLLGGKATPPPEEGEAQPPAEGSNAQPAVRPEDEIKKRLRNLLQ
jgi:AsmA protein